MKKSVLIIGVVLLLAIAGGPPVFGFLLERQLRESPGDSYYSDYVAVHVDEYQRGLYSSTAKIRVAPTQAYLSMVSNAAASSAADDEQAAEVAENFAALLEPLREGLHFDAQVTHGPIGMDGGLFVGMGVTTVTVDSASPAVAEIQRSLNVPYLLRTVIRSNFDGSGQFDAVVPAIDYAEGQSTVKYTGATVTGAYNARANSTQVDGDLGNVEFAEANGRGQLTGIRITSDTEMISKYVGVGNTTFAIDQMVFGVANQSVEVNGLNFTGGMSLSDGKDKVDVKALYAIDGVSEMQGYAASDIKISVVMSDIDVAAVEQYMSALLPTDQAAALPPEELGQAVVEAMYAIAKGSPSFGIDDLSFSLNDDRFDGAINFQVDGSQLPEFADFSMADQQVMMNAVSADARVKATENLVNMIARTVMQQQIAESIPPGSQVSPEELQAVVEQQTPALLNGLVQQGLLIRGDGHYSGEIKFGDGKLMLNGVEMPLGPSPQML